MSTLEMKETPLNITLGNEPLVSIITVVYNGEKFIEKTIRSVVSQTFKDFEFIVIDGGSSDDTLNIIGRYSTFVNLLISERDKGIYDAMNKGATFAKGQYLLYLNAGDLIYPETLTKLFNCTLKVTEFDVIYGDILNATTNHVVSSFHIDQIELDMAFCHQAVLVRKELQLQNKFNLLFKIASDYDFFLKLYRQKKKFIKVPLVFGEFDDTGISNTAFFKVLGEYIRIIWSNANSVSRISSILKYLYHKKKFIAYLTVTKIIGKDRYTRLTTRRK